MPGIITHIVYTQKFLTAYKIPDPENDYLIGTLIPDIRYFGVISREKTHINIDQFAFDKVSDLIEAKDNESSKMFKKGFLFHNLVDNWWAEKYPVSTRDWYQGTALKMSQDKLLFPQLIDQAKIKRHLGSICQKYRLKGVAQNELERWVGLINDYLESSPTVERQITLLKKYLMLSGDKYQLLQAELNKVTDDQVTSFLQTLSQFPPKNIPEIVLG